MKKVWNGLNKGGLWACPTEFYAVVVTRVEADSPEGIEAGGEYYLLDRFDCNGSFQQHKFAPDCLESLIQEMRRDEPDLRKWHLLRARYINVGTGIGGYVAVR